MTDKSEENDPFSKEEKRKADEVRAVLLPFVTRLVQEYGRLHVTAALAGMAMALHVEERREQEGEEKP